MESDDGTSDSTALLLILLINKHGQKKRDRTLYKCRAYPSGSKKHYKAKQAKLTDEEVAAKSRNIQVTILQWQ